MFIRRILGIPFMTGTSRELGKEAADAGVFIVAMRQQPEAFQKHPEKRRKKKKRRARAKRREYGRRIGGGGSWGSLGASIVERWGR